MAARYEGDYEVEKVLARRKKGVIGGCPGLGCNSKKVKKGARRLVLTIAQCCKQVAEKAGTTPEWKDEIEYLVEWQGWTEDHNTWEPGANLGGCVELLSAFHASVASSSACGYSTP